MFAHGFRTVLVLLTAALFTLPAVAQETTMSVPRTIGGLQNNFNGGSTTRLIMPDAGDAIDISTFTMEAGEPGASCAAGPLSHSAWFEILHPGGTLDINTAFSTGSAFDSVVQLFADNTGTLAALNELGCDNDSGGGSNNNDARLVMPDLPSAGYIVRITCIDLCGGTFDLALAISYTPDQSPPANDPVSAAKAIQIGKANLTKKVEHATVAGTENSALGCDMFSTVWYTMTVPTDGSYSFSSFGSFLRRVEVTPSDTKIAVYVSSDGPIFANFTEKGCSDDYGGAIGYGALPAISLNAGEEVYVRVGSFSASNMLDGSYYRFKATIVNLNNVLTNSGFESGTLAPWKMTITSGIEGITNVYGNSSSYSARMVGGPDKTNTLKQKWSVGNIKLPNDSTALATLSYSTNGTTSNSAVAMLKITFTDGAAPLVTKTKLDRQTAASAFKPVYLYLLIKSGNVKEITLSVKNKSSGGLLFIDSANLRIYGDPTRGPRQSLDLLPVPEAPPLTLRGTN